MSRLTEEMIIARTRQSDLSAVNKLNCWGADLEDVSLLRKMPNVRVLALSLNKISTLCNFEECYYLEELYLRKNDIRDLSELDYLKNLKYLKNLWVDENPCAAVENYRMKVLQILPNLEILDNIVVNAEEVHESLKFSKNSASYDQESSYIVDESEVADNSQDYAILDDKEVDPYYNDDDTAHGRSPEYSPQSYRQFDEHAAAESTHYANNRSEQGHSASRAYAMNGGPSVQAQGVQSSVANCVMGNLRGFHRRPIGRNSNLLSAVLCLVKELDYSSLEVVELAVRCRMDEINS